MDGIRPSFWIIAVLLVNSVLLQNSLCNAEVLIQDVLWSREYDEGLDENYFGTCRFVPSPCGMNGDGVCVQSGRCAKHGGILNGDCGGGTGECCMFQDQCSTGRSSVDVSQLVTILDSPENTTAPCSFRIRKVLTNSYFEPRICQVRLDFMDFTTQSANAEGNCDVDKLHIKNSITVDDDFVTCGRLSGQHMYLTFGADRDMIEVTPILKSFSSRYRIVVTKIPCESKKRAPDYCLQYHTTPSGIIQSLDFGQQQQNNQRYTICTKPDQHSTQIQWRPCGGRSESFDIITNFGGVAATCQTDWVQIRGSERICEAFVQHISSWKAYDLLVNFDGTELPTPPPSFNMPVNPNNCAAECTGQPGMDCACIEVPPATQCQCFMEMPPISGIDLNNTGFCLEYSQE